MPQQKTTIKLPKGLTSGQRQAIGQDIVEFIRTRSVAGKDKNNRNFPRYTKKYAAEKGQTNVDLVLSSEMLEALKVLKHRSGSVTVGYNKGDTRNNGVAEGNRKGTYGQSRPIPGKKRDFLGISSGFLKQIVRENG